MLKKIIQKDEKKPFVIFTFYLLNEKLVCVDTETPNNFLFVFKILLQRCIKFLILHPWRGGSVSNPF